jgi:hypothetical protein
LHENPHVVPLHVGPAFGGTVQPVSHVPPQQKAPVPHDVVSGAFPVETHCCVPVLQSYAPARHGLASVHEPPAVHATHEPALQTMLVPQAVPLEACVPVSVHVLVVQFSEPTSHGFAVGMHAAPFVHVVHVPLSQTWPVPHDVPLSPGMPVSVQVDTPVEQSVLPV